MILIPAFLLHPYLCNPFSRSRLDADLVALRATHEALSAAHATAESTLSTVVPERDTLASACERLRVELSEAKAMLATSEDSRIAAEVGLWGGVGPPGLGAVEEFVNSGE